MEAIKQASIFSLKVWLTALLLPAVLVISLFKLSSHDMFGYLMSLIKVVGILSIVGLVLFIAVNYLLLLTVQSIAKVKGILSVVAVILISFGYATGIGITYLPPNLGNIAAYSLIAIASIWVYKLKQLSVTHTKPANE